MQRAKPALTKPDPPREGKSCGLNVKPEVTFRKGQKQKENNTV
jgi:hypothetical protein